MKKSLYIVASLVLAIGTIYCSSSQSAAPGLQRVVIIRHGEKPPQGDNLSCQGLNRALALPPVLYSKIGVPSTVYVPAIDQGKSTNVARMYQTIVPFAVRYNLDINTKYEVDDAEGLVNAMRKRSGTVLVVWEHKKISKILTALGIETKEKWDESDFDGMWIVDLSKGKPVLTKDVEGIKPAAECK